MKTIEEKAKAYDEALERAKAYHRNELAGSRREMTEYIFPELRESEDERIRKAILVKMKATAKSNNYFRKEEIEWVERQKEQKPATMKPHKGDDGNPYDMGVSEAQEYAIKRGFGIPFNDGEVFVDERYITQTIGNILRWADEHPKEQKSAEKQDYSGLTDFERAIHRGFLCAGVENVPVTIIKETAQDCLAQQKPAWSEEDKANLDNIIWLCENCEKGIENVWIPSQATQIKNLIKSLRPSWKPSKEQRC